MTTIIVDGWDTLPKSSELPKNPEVGFFCKYKGDYWIFTRNGWLTLREVKGELSYDAVK